MQSLKLIDYIKKRLDDMYLVMCAIKKEKLLKIWIFIAGINKRELDD